MSDDNALRYNEGKPSLSMVAPEIIEGLAQVYMAGAKKYPKNNWRKGAPITQTMDSALRHIMKYLSHKHSDYDEETGCHHLYHAIWNLGTAVIHQEEYPHLDDRYKGEKESD